MKIVAEIHRIPLRKLERKLMRNCHIIMDMCVFVAVLAYCRQQGCLSPYAMGLIKELVSSFFKVLYIWR